MSKEGRQKALETTLAGLNKRYGEGAVMKLGEASRLQVEAIPSGSLSLDIALGVGGVPRGVLSNSMARRVRARPLFACMSSPRRRSRAASAALLDVEHALNPAYAAKIGVDVDNLYVSQPDAGEQALGDHRGACALQRQAVVVVDSVAALVPWLY